MAAETDFIRQLRLIATNAGARGLLDDAAVVPVNAGQLVITHDMLVEGVHFLVSDPPESVAWKLLAVNLSDLAAKGAVPRYAVMGYMLAGDAEWDKAFIKGLREAITHFNVSLIGGDTVAAKERSFGLTLIGEADQPVPSRAGAGNGDALFVTGVIGDAGAGLTKARAVSPDEDDPLVQAYRSPQPQIAAGQQLAPGVSAMMDISDGLLIDCARLCQASGVAAMIDLDAIPLSQPFKDEKGGGREARLFAATAGDDYQLLFTSSRPLPTLPCPVTRIGRIVSGSGVHLYDRDGAVPLPRELGWMHG